MPLAHPTSITATNNYDEPCVAVSFATSRPGEPLADFRHRMSTRDHYTRTRGVELVLDRAASELVKMLIPVVGRTEIGLRIDLPKCCNDPEGFRGVIDLTPVGVHVRRYGRAHEATGETRLLRELPVIHEDFKTSERRAFVPRS